MDARIRIVFHCQKPIISRLLKQVQIQAVAEKGKKKRYLVLFVHKGQHSLPTFLVVLFCYKRVKSLPLFI